MVRFSDLLFEYNMTEDELKLLCDGYARVIENHKRVPEIEHLLPKAPAMMISYVIWVFGEKMPNSHNVDHDEIYLWYHERLKEKRINWKKYGF